MSDDMRPDEAPVTPSAEPRPLAPSIESAVPTQPISPQLEAQPLVSPPVEFEAAELTAAAQAAAAPPATGPSPEPPPVGGWAAPPPAPPMAPAEPQPEGVASPPVVPSAYPAAEALAPRRSGLGTAILAAILAALVVGAFTGLAGGLFGAQLALRSQSPAQTAGGNITVVPSKTAEPVVAAAAAAVPSVVNIDIQRASQRVAPVACRARTRPYPSAATAPAWRSVPLPTAARTSSRTTTSSTAPTT